MELSTWLAFIDPAKPALLQYLICAATLTVIDLPVMGSYTYFASRALKRLRGVAQIRWMNRSFGGLFILAGGVLATFKRHA